MKYLVQVQEQRTVTVIRRKVFEASSVEEAISIAESEDWRTWEVDAEGNDTEAFIEFVEPTDLDRVGK